jgi:large subunit ribosomal protein L6
LTAALEGNNRLTISGIDRELVGQTCAEIRSLRPPEPYKGKGIRYEDEYVRRKIGKAGIK